MPLRVTTDHVEIRDVIDLFLAADPVRGTLLGTIGATLEDTAWAAYGGPRLAVRSTAHYPVAIAGDWDGPKVAELAELLGPLPGLRGVSGAVDVVEALLDALGPGRVSGRMAQRLFRLDALKPPWGIDGRGVVATDLHRRTVRRWIAAFLDEADAFGPRNDAFADSLVKARMCWLWLDVVGEPVSIAARRPVVGGSSRVGPVYTPPAERGHGYGSAVTAAATRSILDEGAIPVLFTDLANETSNKIYQALGYEPVEDRLVVTFS